MWFTCVVPFASAFMGGGRKGNPLNYCRCSVHCTVLVSVILSQPRAAQTPGSHTARSSHLGQQQSTRNRSVTHAVMCAKHCHSRAYLHLMPGCTLALRLLEHRSSSSSSNGHEDCWVITMMLPGLLSRHTLATASTMGIGPF